MGRQDGKKASYLDPMVQMMPYIMTKRSDATNTAKVELKCDAIDKFIAEQKQQGNVFSYNDVIVSSLVRLYATRLQLNRFVIGRKIYDRYKMTVAFVIKKGLKENGAETTVKLDFDGSESIFDVRDKIAKVVAENMKEDVNITDLAMSKLLSLPSWVLRFVMWIIRGLDRCGNLPSWLLDASPFHTSCFITFLKSIKCDYIYHHIYDFGTTGLFFAMGKDKRVPVVGENGEVTVGKSITMGVTMDERFCDGLYMANTVRYWQTLLSHPDKLLQKVEPVYTKELVLKRRKENIEKRKAELKELSESFKRNKKLLKQNRRKEKKEQKAAEKQRRAQLRQQNKK